MKNYTILCSYAHRQWKGFAGRFMTRCLMPAVSKLDMSEWSVDCWEEGDAEELGRQNLDFQAEVLSVDEKGEGGRGGGAGGWRSK